MFPSQAWSTKWSETVSHLFSHPKKKQKKEEEEEEKGRAGETKRRLIIPWQLAVEQTDTHQQAMQKPSLYPTARISC